jgi:hypothetical protein
MNDPNCDPAAKGFVACIEDVQKAFGIEEDLFQKYVKGEIKQNEDLIKLITLRENCTDWKNEINIPGGGWGTTLNACILYSLVRHYDMDSIIETGVSGGYYTSFMLAALNQNNNHGLLTSLEISNDTKEVGKLVPKIELNEGVDWSLNLGKSSLDHFKEWKQKGIVHCADLYCHDSFHSMGLMLSELTYFKESTSDNFIVYMDDQGSENFWNRCLGMNAFRKIGYSVKYISGQECRAKAHLGGFLKFEKIK